MSEEHLFMLELSELVTRFVALNKRCAVAIMYNDERHPTEDYKAVRIGLSKNDAPAHIVQYFTVHDNNTLIWPSNEIARLGRELITRGSSVFIGFDNAGEVSCQLFGEPSEGCMLVETMLRTIGKYSPQFGEIW